MNKQLVEMTKGRWREFRREPSAIFWVIFMPIFWMVVLGFALGSKNEATFNVGWIENEQSLNSFREALEQDPKIQLQTGSADHIETLNRDNRLLVILNFNDQPPHIYYDFNNTQSTIAARYVEDLLESAAGRRNLLQLQRHDQLKPEQRYVDFLIPGLLGLSILTTSLFGTAMTLVSARRENLLKRYLTTPMQPKWFFTSHVLGRLMTLSVEVIAIFAAGWLIFGYAFWHNLASFLLLCVLGAAAFTALAIFLGSRIRDVATMSSIVKLITLPMMMISGVFFAVSAFPFWIQPLLKVLPLTALIDGLRKVNLEGAVLTDLGFEISVLVICTVIGMVGSLKFFRWE